MDLDYSSAASSRAPSSLTLERDDLSRESNHSAVEDGYRTRRSASAPPRSQCSESEPLIPNRTAVSYSVSRNQSDEAVRLSAIRDGLGLMTFKRRFYILAVYFWMSFSFGMLWSTWAPIAHSAQQALQFTAGDIALLQNSGPIGFFATFFIFWWMVDKKGPRWVMVTCSTLSFLGAGIRCFIGINRDAAKILIYIGQFMIGTTFYLPQIMAPVVSAVWFPAEQRATATAVGVVATPIGMAITGAVEPYIVRETNNSSGNWNETSRDLNTPKTNATLIAEDIQFNEIVHLMIIQTAIVAVGFLCVIFYFPNKPPLPPAMSQSDVIKRSSFKEGAKKLLKMPDYWLLCVAAAVPYGLGTGWLTLLDVNLMTLRIPQQLVGWLVFGFLVSGVVTSILIGRIGDLLGGRYKIMTTFLLAIGLLSIIWFSLQVQKFIAYSDATLATSVIISGVSLGGLWPLVLEMVLEHTYPIQEGISLSILNIVLNLTMLVFYFIKLIPDVGTTWMNWAFVGVLVICLPMFIASRTKYNRLRLDSISRGPGVSNDAFT